MRWRKANTSDRGRDHSWTAAATLPARARSRASSSCAVRFGRLCWAGGGVSGLLWAGGRGQVSRSSEGRFLAKCWGGARGSAVEGVNARVLRLKLTGVCVSYGDLDCGETASLGQLLHSRWNYV